MPPRDSLLARSLEPFISALWIFFVLASVLIGVVWAFGIGEGNLEKGISNADLRLTLAWLLGRGDLVWILLAAINVYLSLAGCQGLAVARRWALIILLSVVALGWISVLTGFPLGRIRYGSPLSLGLGPLPLGLPLFWFAAIVGAREAVLAFLPRLSLTAAALVTGVLVFLTDLNLEPLAAKWRGLWFWKGASPTLPPVFDAPLIGSVAWGLLATGLCLVLREKSVVTTSNNRPGKPAATWLIFNAVFLVSHLAHWLRH